MLLYGWLGYHACYDSNIDRVCMLSIVVDVLRISEWFTLLERLEASVIGYLTTIKVDVSTLKKELDQMKCTNFDFFVSNPDHVDPSLVEPLVPTIVKHMEGGQHDGLEKSPNGDISNAETNEGDIVAAHEKAAIGMHQSNFESFQDLEDISIDAVMKVSQKETSIVGISGVTPHSMEVVKTEVLQQISLGCWFSSPVLAPIRSIPQNAPNWRSVMQGVVLTNREENDKVRYAGESSRSGASINRHIVEQSTIAVTNATRHDVKSGEETFHQTDQILREVQNGETSSDLVGYPAESIFLIRGYDGVSWLTALGSYSPSNDVVKSLKPMHSVQSYAGVAELCGQLFVFGGGDGGAIGAESLWYDTVVSYKPATNMWTLHPPLKTKKGTLAGATWKDRIFAIGGANVIVCFSEVEMYDPQFGCWFNTRPMSQKRSCLAAAELNGALYAVGGYDGSNYLATAERFDPREFVGNNKKYEYEKRISYIDCVGWEVVCYQFFVLFDCKSSRRGYALGGYDGSTMVRSTEIYDPRLATWMVGEPMELARGYSAAAVLQDSIYVIGGVKSNEEIVDVIECYKPGVGWKTLNLKGIGRRCICSAIVLTND
ncbi:uncharacterized protein LOC125808607 [Solanum verrucosum]|uniref:uncharacterized protein LOC125808607 n=1 Tax=Solanum verrucosum TaxID=315347 RepID=UPI0020D0D7ED|nr:uncharacterized protein LOC125808607 [Solanum verrucosum]